MSFLNIISEDSDPTLLWAEIHRLREEIHRLREELKVPDGFNTWKDAATAERVRRVKAEAEIKRRDEIARGDSPKAVIEGLIGYIPGISWSVNPKFQKEQTIKITRESQPQYGFTVPIFIGQAVPDMRHPKIQAILGLNAHLKIELGLIEDLLKDPDYEASPVDMDYWGPTHDKIVELQRKVKEQEDKEQEDKEQEDKEQEDKEE